MSDTREFINNCKNLVLEKRNLPESMINNLFNIEDKFLKDLSDAANEITRTFQGSKIDIEQLANIKKNYSC